jgi:hypothetical protein
VQRVLLTGLFAGGLFKISSQEDCALLRGRVSRVVLVKQAAANLPVSLGRTASQDFGSRSW